MRALLALALFFPCAKETPPPAPPPVQPTPAPGQGCQPKTVAPPCTLASVTPILTNGAVRFRVLYQDARGEGLLVNVLEGAEQDRPAIERWYQAHAKVDSCSGGWTTAPCPDDQRLAGFPPPPPGVKVIQ